MGGELGFPFQFGRNGPGGWLILFEPESHVWLVDPVAKTLEVFKLVSDHWMLAQTAGEDQKVRAEPFQEVEIDLNNLWWD